MTQQLWFSQNYSATIHNNLSDYVLQNYLLLPQIKITGLSTTYILTVFVENGVRVILSKLFICSGIYGCVQENSTSKYLEI